MQDDAGSADDETRCTLETVFEGALGVGSNVCQAARVHEMWADYDP